MKLLLAVLALISVDSVAADCPKAAKNGPARSTPSTIPFMPTHQIVSCSSPRQSFERCSRGNGNIRRERSGIWITTPGLEARMAKLASRFASPSRRSRRIRQLFPCHIRSCLTPSTRPNGTRCTWSCASENTSAGSFKISSLRAATRCHMCIRFRSPDQLMKPAATLPNKLTPSLPFTRPWAFPSMSHHLPRAPFSLFATFALSGYPVYLANSQSARFSLGHFP